MLHWFKPCIYDLTRTLFQLESVTYVCMYVCIYVCMYKNACVHSCMCICRYMYMHTYVCACMYEYMHISLLMNWACLFSLQFLLTLSFLGGGILFQYISTFNHYHAQFNVICKCQLILQYLKLYSWG